MVAGSVCASLKHGIWTISFKEYFEGSSASYGPALWLGETISFAIPARRLSIWLHHANHNVTPAHRSQKHLLRCALVPDRSYQLRRPALDIHRKCVEHPDAPPLAADRLKLWGVFHLRPRLPVIFPVNVADATRGYHRFSAFTLGFDKPQCPRVILLRVLVVAQERNSRNRDQQRDQRRAPPEPVRRFFGFTTDSTVQRGGRHHRPSHQNEQSEAQQVKIKSRIHGPARHYGARCRNQPRQYEHCCHCS